MRLARRLAMIFTGTVAAAVSGGATGQSPFVNDIQGRPDASAAPAPASPPPPSCPPDMALVEGEYCPKLHEECKTWAPPRGGRMGSYARICEEFKFPTRCLTKKTVPMRFCMDTHEYSDDGPGGLPRVMIDYHEMKAICTAQGKRLCDDDEFTQACRGPDNLPFAYGYKRDAEACHLDVPDPKVDLVKIARRDPEEVAKADFREPTGARPFCGNGVIFGLADNVTEITHNASRGEHPHKLALKGGHMNGSRAQCTPAIRVHDEKYFYPRIGGRCCAEAAAP